ncbi:MAG: hypothetical protein KF729_11605 [Sandaracinaceae bacterium]|nr:hypothetical protein [Sandaracinaceae bacterium]
MRRLLIALFVLVAGCVETVRCPDGEIFDARGECVPIPDAGADAGPDAAP